MADAAADSKKPPRQHPWWLRVIYNLTHLLFVGVMSPWFHVRVENRPPLETMGPVILAPNHVSYLDPPVLQRAALKHITFMMTEVIYEFKWVRWIFRLWGAIPVPETRAPTGAIKSALRALRDGQPVCIFPEGKISEDGTLQDGQGGVSMLLVKAGVPVIPVAILGTYEVLPKKARWLRRHNVLVRFGAPLVPARNLARSEWGAFAEEVMGAIADLGAPVSEERRKRIVAQRELAAKAEEPASAPTAS